MFLTDFKYPFFIQLWKYLTTTWNVIDFLTIFPFYLQYFGITAHSLAFIRIMRLIRMARLQILTRDKFDKEVVMLKHTLANSGKMIAALMFVCILILAICGSAMYLIEGVSNII